MGNGKLETEERQLGQAHLAARLLKLNRDHWSIEPRLQSRLLRKRTLLARRPSWPWRPEGLRGFAQNFGFGTICGHAKLWSAVACHRFVRFGAVSRGGTEKREQAPALQSAHEEFMCKAGLR